MTIKIAGRRKTGRTTSMLVSAVEKALTGVHVYIIVHRQEFARYLYDLAPELRKIKNITIYSMNHQCVHKRTLHIDGVNQENIFIDHYVFEVLNSQRI